MSHNFLAQKRKKRDTLEKKLFPHFLSPNVSIRGWTLTLNLWMMRRVDNHCATTLGLFSQHLIFFVTHKRAH